MKQERYEHAVQLWQAKNYEQCLQYLSEHMWEEAPDLKTYLLQSRCYWALGDPCQAIHFPWDLIDYQYPEAVDLEAVSLLKECSALTGVMLESDRFATRLSYMSGKDVKTARLQREAEMQEDIFAEDRVDLEALLRYCRYLYTMDDAIKAAYYHVVYLQLMTGEEPEDSRELFEELKREKNVGLIYELLRSDDADTMTFVIDNMQDYDMYFAMAKVCRYLGKKAFFLSAPVELEIEGGLPDPEESLRLSYENMEEIDGVSVTTSLQYRKEDKIADATLLLLLDDLSRQAKGGQLLLMAERNVFRTMRSAGVKRAALHYVAANEDNYGQPFTTTFGYVNGYANHASMLYRVDVIRELKKTPKYAYSIVIPVRNNINTVGSTLRTCLEQDFEDYEILVSDNSDDGNGNIPGLLHSQFDSEKIRYIKTPRVLPITKSFEYAYMQADGDFLIPLGADDGLLLRALPELDRIRRKLEKKESINILSWDRIHYVWEGMSESGQEGQFIIPRPYRREEDPVEPRDSQAMLKWVMTDPGRMYGLPLLYINSGMKKEYLYTMLERTGAILDGHSQDLYTGIVNLALNEHFYHIKKPVTMAALSSHSSGATSIIGNVSDEIVEDRRGEFFACNDLYPMPRDSENLFMMSDGDVANLLTQILRVIDMECIPLEWVNEIDWHAMGRNIYEQMQYMDINKYKVEKHLLKSVALFSQPAADELQREITAGVIQNNRFELVKERRYFKGFAPGGALHLDASEFGVTDVYEACRLFDKICNIY